jgi:hypothetical protein
MLKLLSYILVFYLGIGAEKIMHKLAEENKEDKMDDMINGG